jgi:hypothetical protein
MLTREQVLGAKVELRREEVPTPELGGSVLVRLWTASERDRFESRIMAGGLEDRRARVIALSVCDELGNLLFTEADIPRIGGMPSDLADRIALAALKLNDLADDDMQAPRPGPAAAFAAGTPPAARVIAPAPPGATAPGAVS